MAVRPAKLNRPWTSSAEGARFSEAYVKVGLIPGDGGTYFLPRLVGTAKALELFWTGDFIDAQEALRIGLVNRIYLPERLMPEVYEFAGRLAAGPTVAIRTVKRAVYRRQLSADRYTSYLGLFHGGPT